MSHSFRGGSGLAGPSPAGRCSVAPDEIAQTAAMASTRRWTVSAMPCAQAAEIFPLAANLVAVFPIARMAPRAAAFAFFFGVASW